MADRSVPLVIRLGISAVQVLHAPGEIGLRRLDDQVVVIAYEAISVAEPFETLDGLAQEFEKCR